MHTGISCLFAATYLKFSFEFIRVNFLHRKSNRTTFMNDILSNFQIQSLYLYFYISLKFFKALRHVNSQSRKLTLKHTYFQVRANMVSNFVPKDRFSTTQLTLTSILRKKCVLFITGKSLSEALLFAEHRENMLYTKIVLNVRNNFCTQHVLPRFELVIQ